MAFGCDKKISKNIRHVLVPLWTDFQIPVGGRVGEDGTPGRPAAPLARLQWHPWLKIGKKIHIESYCTVTLLFRYDWVHLAHTEPNRAKYFMK